MKINKVLAAGIAIGLIVGMSSAAFALPAIESIQAFANRQMTFEFDGEKVALPTGYEVLVYNNRSYVPARFIAEQLDAKVDWNDTSKVISITSKDGGKKEETPVVTPTYTYKKLPLTHSANEYTLKAYMYSFSNGGDRLYLTLEGEDKGTSVRLVQGNTKIVVGGTEYKVNISDGDLDMKWYKNITDNEDLTGYILMPKTFKGQSGMHIELEVNVSPHASYKTDHTDTVAFDIAL